MEFHIGNIIKKVANDKRVGPTELGSKISTSKQNIYGIFRRQSIDTKLLMKLSRALGHDFFMEYVRYIGINQSTPYTPEAKSDGEVGRQVQIELDYLGKANNDLRKANDDLRKANDDLRTMVEWLQSQVAQGVTGPQGH